MTTDAPALNLGFIGLGVMGAPMAGHLVRAGHRVALLDADPARARAVARRLRTGNVHINGAPIDMAAPFGGYKQSGLGREWGAWGIDEFLEVKAMLGYGEGD